jgi:chloramphenicol 3-O-phosphotransferase
MPLRIGKVAQTAAVCVDQQQAAPDERRDVGNLIGQTDDSDRPAVLARCDVLQGGVEVAAADDHRVRAFRLAVRAAADRQVEVAHDEHGHRRFSMPDGTRLTLS